MRSVNGGTRSGRTIVAHRRTDIVWVLSVDFLVGVSTADVPIGPSDWLRNAGRWEGFDLANVGKGDVSFGILIDGA